MAKCLRSAVLQGLVQGQELIVYILAFQSQLLGKSRWKVLQRGEAKD